MTIREIGQVVFVVIGILMMLDIWITRKKR
jgi:hypothetical protein